MALPFKPRFLWLCMKRSVFICHHWIRGCKPLDEQWPLLCGATNSSWQGNRRHIFIFSKRDGTTVVSFLLLHDSHFPWGSFFLAFLGIQSCLWLWTHPQPTLAMEMCMCTEPLRRVVHGEWPHAPHARLVHITTGPGPGPGLCCVPAA